VARPDARAGIFTFEGLSVTYMKLTQPSVDLGTAVPGLPTGMPHSWSRLDGVDILRGLAILLVLMNHVHMRLFLMKIPYLQDVPSQLASSLVWNGQWGVQIFFAVSGFLITSTSIRRWGSLASVSLRDFYALRVARIEPLLLLLLVVLCTLDAVGLKHFVVAAETGGVGRALIAALIFHINLSEARHGYLPANWDILWSLSVEEMFYLFFPVVCWLLGGSKWLFAFLMIFVVLGPPGRNIFAHGNEIWQEYSYLGGMDAIALGCLTAVAASRITIPNTLILVFGGAGAALMLLILGFSNEVQAWGVTQAQRAARCAFSCARSAQRTLGVNSHSRTLPGTRFSSWLRWIYRPLILELSPLSELL
jgi:peptidoglycan/LPS O-acetylase OafA/YrhL